MFEHQIKLQDQYSAEPHETKMVQDNSAVLKRRIQALKESKQSLEAEMQMQRQHLLSLERDINTTKPDKNKAERLKERYQT